MENNIIPTVGVVVVRDGQVLLVRHGEASGHISGVYGLPAGRMMENETERETAQRELKEETGLSAEPTSLLEIPKLWRAVIERKDGVKEFSFKVFVAPVFSGDLKSGEETEPEWVNIDDLDQYDLLPNVKLAIEEGVGMLKQIKRRQD